MTSTPRPPSVGFALALALLAAGDRAAGESWTPLLDPSLSQWETWTGVPHESVPIEWEGKSVDGKTGRPLGLGWNERDLFAVRIEAGEPVLRISGEIYAGLTTLEEFGDYHLRLEFRWGDAKWPPRLERLRDSGLLYHGTGAHGAFWNVWMRSLECQIQEGDCGDLYVLGGTVARIRGVEPAPGEWPRHDPAGPLVDIGPGGRPAARHGPSEEKPHGEWNVVELYTVGDRALHVVNGRVVLALQDAALLADGRRVPLERGRIQLQSEGAEIHYRRVAVKPLREFPAGLARAAGWATPPSAAP